MAWENWLLQHEVLLRLSCFLMVFSLMSSWEVFKPCRSLKISKTLRWTNNLALVLCYSLLLRLMFPIAAVGLAMALEHQGWGLLNSIELPLWLELFLAVVVLDLIIYLQHLSFHKIPMLWRMHRVHHADPDFDVTTGIRFHPLEIILSLVIKFIAIIVLGPAAVAVLIFEVLLSAFAVFNHANVSLPQRLDKWLRLLVVTPDMHRVHHSWLAFETNSNYGFALSIWDRLFSTYHAQPCKGHKGMDIGLRQFRKIKQVCWLGGILRLPFKD